MTEHGDIKDQMLEMIKRLSVEQLAELNDALRDALRSAARGQPSRYAINALVHLTQEEARRICGNIGLDWESGEPEPDGM